MWKSFIKKKFSLNSNPKRTICLSFLFTIVMGMFLLKLPFATTSNKPLSFFYCFFTATATTCISGVPLHDTFSHWTFFGQIIILILTQLGALGVLTLYSIFAISINKKLNLKSMQLAGDQISAPSFANFKSLFKSVLYITLSCEVIGAILLSFTYYPNFKLYGIFMAFFTAVSSYCNAGLDLNGIIQPNCSFIPFQNNYYVLTITSLLTFLGSLGVIVIYEIIKLKKQHKKLKFLSINSKTAIFTSSILILLGSIIFFTLEFNHSLNNLNLFDKIFTSIFHSISTRSNGYLTLNLASLTNLTKVILCVLMLIGGCPSGTGGGLKTTTLTILFATTFNTIKNRKHIYMFKHKINEFDIYKAISTLIITIITITSATILIYKFDTIIQLPTIIFTAISVFANTGFQTVPVACFCNASKLIFLFLMFIGRIGPLNFTATFLNIKNSKKQISLPEGKIQTS